MGVSVSTKDFATLEGYVYKSGEEREEILEHAGWKLEAQDHDIAIFMGTDVVTAALIRAVVTV
ncbi:18021_t:CDS:1, partial [Rhizophagus irregularis]